MIQLVNGQLSITPDWSTAPQWAQWWGVDSCGCAWWYEAEPKEPQPLWRIFPDYTIRFTPEQQIALATFDWQATLQQRK